MREHLSFKMKAMDRSIRNPNVNNFDHVTEVKMWSRIAKNIWGKKESLVIWTNVIKSIEGQHGSGVGTFFRFLRHVPLTFRSLKSAVCLPFEKIAAVCLQFEIPCVSWT